MTYVHGGVDLTDSVIVCWELIYLDTVAHQLTHNLYFEFMELTLGDCVRFGNDGNYVDLRRGRDKERGDCTHTNNVVKCVEHCTALVFKLESAKKCICIPVLKAALC